MIPIPATLKVVKKIPVDPNNPDHEKYVGFQSTIEEISYVDGLYLGLVNSKSSKIEKLLDGYTTNQYGNRIEEYREEFISSDNVRAEFWAEDEEEDWYRVRVVDYDDIIIKGITVRNSFHKFHSK